MLHIVLIKSRQNLRRIFYIYVCVCVCHNQQRNMSYQVLFNKTNFCYTGSEKPPEVKGQARLYSMKYCPFSHRIRLILTLKQIPHDIININLQNKPDWYLQVCIKSFLNVTFELNVTFLVIYTKMFCLRYIQKAKHQLT
jgi:hypothetical protein